MEIQSGGASEAMIAEADAAESTGFSLSLCFEKVD